MSGCFAISWLLGTLKADTESMPSQLENFNILQYSAAYNVSATTLEMDAPAQKASNGQCETDRFIVTVLLQTIFYYRYVVAMGLSP